MGLSLVAFLAAVSPDGDRGAESPAEPYKAPQIFNDHEAGVRCYYYGETMVCYKMPETASEGDSITPAWPDNRNTTSEV